MTWIVLANNRAGFTGWCGPVPIRFRSIAEATTRGGLDTFPNRRAAERFAALRSLFRWRSDPAGDEAHILVCRVGDKTWRSAYRGGRLHDSQDGRSYRPQDQWAIDDSERVRHRVLTERTEKKA